MSEEDYERVKGFVYKEAPVGHRDPGAFPPVPVIVDPELKGSPICLTKPPEVKVSKDDFADLRKRLAKEQKGYIAFSGRQLDVK